MKIDFEELKTVEVENMNGGAGFIKSKMFIDDNCKIIRAVLSPNSSMGKHTQNTNEFIYVLSGQAKIIINGTEEIVGKGQLHYCPIGSTHEIFNNTQEDLILLDITANMK